MTRILVIRGGAIGDFILTLPALKALRDANPTAQIEVLGYKHIAELVHNRFYANAVRSIDYGPLSRFFAKDSELGADLNNYFGSFDLVISYLFDPDRAFETNVRRCGVEQFVRGPTKIRMGNHAVRQLTAPMEQLGFTVNDLAAKVYPSADDRQMARDFLKGAAQPMIVFHPSSGGERKNWPLENWIALGDTLLRSPNFEGSVLVVSGEADEAKTERLRLVWSDARVRFAESLPLPHLGAVLENAIFVGHDSGISHLAAAVGCNCILLFGPSDPAVWAPLGQNIRVIRAPGGDLRALDVETVFEVLWCGHSGRQW